MKQALAFDLDKTLNDSKLPLSPQMARIFTDVLRRYPACIISGQKYAQFEVQVLAPLQKAGATAAELKNLHLMVGQGTQYYAYQDGKWQQVYNHALTTEQFLDISRALESAARELGYWIDLKGDDEIIENRESMVAYSALGQKADLQAKEAWDPDMQKRQAIAAKARALAPAYTFEIGGTTTINAFLPGMNKVYGMNQWLRAMDFAIKDVLYFGDMTQPGGNDFPVVEMGFTTVTVEKWQDTAFALQGILGFTE